jgi:hypothetical protein
MAKSKLVEPTIEESIVETPIEETPIVETTEEVAPPLLNEAAPERVEPGYPSRDFYTAL